MTLFSLPLDNDGLLKTVLNWEIYQRDYVKIFPRPRRHTGSVGQNYYD